MPWLPICPVTPTLAVDPKPKLALAKTQSRRNDSSQRAPNLLLNFLQLIGCDVHGLNQLCARRLALHSNLPPVFHLEANPSQTQRRSDPGCRPRTPIRPSHRPLGFG